MQIYPNGWYIKNVPRLRQTANGEWQIQVDDFWK